MNVRSRFRLSGPLTGLVSTLVLAFAPVIGQAQQTADTGPKTRHPEAAEAIASLRSPFCPGFMLDVCTSPQAAVMRDSINVLANAGWEADRLIEWFIADYGEEWRAIPKAEGGGLVAWVVPPALFLLGLVVVVVALRVMRKRAGPEQDPAENLSDHEEERLAQALHELELEEEPVF